MRTVVDLGVGHPFRPRVWVCGLRRDGTIPQRLHVKYLLVEALLVEGRSKPIFSETEDPVLMVWDSCRHPGTAKPWIAISSAISFAVWCSAAAWV